MVERIFPPGESEDEDGDDDDYYDDSCPSCGFDILDDECTCNELNGL